MCGDAKGMYGWRQYLQFIQQGDSSIPSFPCPSSSSSSSSSFSSNKRIYNDVAVRQSSVSTKSNTNTSADHLCGGNSPLIKALTASRCNAQELYLSSPSPTAVTMYLDSVFLSHSRAVSQLSGMLSAYAVQGPSTGHTLQLQRVLHKMSACICNISHFKATNNGLIISSNIVLAS